MSTNEENDKFTTIRVSIKQLVDGEDGFIETLALGEVTDLLFPRDQFIDHRYLEGMTKAAISKFLHDAATLDPQPEVTS